MVSRILVTVVLTVCILAPYGSILKKPYIVEHTKESINELVLLLHSLHEETKIVMESYFILSRSIDQNVNLRGYTHVS